MSSTLQRLQELRERRQEMIGRLEKEIAEARTRGRFALFSYLLAKGEILDSIRAKLNPTVKEEELLTQRQAHLANQTLHERTRCREESFKEAQRNAQKIIFNQGLIMRFRENKIEALRIRAERIEEVEAVLA